MGLQKMLNKKDMTYLMSKTEKFADTWGKFSIFVFFSTLVIIHSTAPQDINFRVGSMIIFGVLFLSFVLYVGGVAIYNSSLYHKLKNKAK